MSVTYLWCWAIGIIVGLIVFSGDRLAAAGPKIPSASAEMAPRDVLRHTLEPFVNIFTREPAGAARAFSLRFRLLEATNQPPELCGSSLHIYCQPPDRLFVQFFALGAITTISRQGQSVWASPARLLTPVLERASALRLTKEDQEPLATLKLPVPTSLFWLLFRLVKVRDGGEAIYGGQVCRRLELDSPEAEDRGKFLRLWIRSDDFKLLRLDWQGPSDHVWLAADEAELVPSLPGADFQPDAAEKADLLSVPVDRFRPFMTLLGKDEKKRQKQFDGS